MAKVLMKGNEALAESALRAGCRFFSGYPITPQTEILEYMSWRMKEVGGEFVQTESEVAGINMLFGAAAAGARALTPSSGPGFSLKQEGISYLCGTELPAVIADVMRIGSALGNVFQGQGDYWQLTRGGGHGDYRTIVLAPNSVQENADMAYEAFDLAEKYRHPVIVASDAAIGQMVEAVELKEFKEHDINTYDWAVRGRKDDEPKRTAENVYYAMGADNYKEYLLKKYQEIEEKLNATAAERDKVFNEFTAPIREQLDKMGLKYRILARVKSIYSIWNKMQTKHVPFEEIYDLLAVRIIFEPRNIDEELNDCFDIYVSISKIYKPHPDRLRDWVSHPKANGYQALHVTLMGNNGQWIEVQIRSERMNDVAEQGFAAHWKYKEGGGSEDEGELEKWLRTIKEILDDPQPDAIDFLDTIKLNLFASEIFVFTPKGELKTMPQNSTALDFAFSLHTDIGSHCIGAKVNHKLVPLSHKLQSGDQVEILTSKSQRVQPQWEVFATTARARAKIAAILRKERKTFQKEGEELLNEFFKKEEIRPEAAVIEKLCKLHNMKNEEEFLVAIGNKTIVLGDADKNELKEKQSSNWMKYLTFSFGNNKDKQQEEKEPQEKEKINTKQILKLTEDALQKKYIMAECCHPIPGDDVLGYMDENDRIIIHKRQCPVAAKLKSSYGNRIIATEWDTHKKLSFLVYIYIKGIDNVGLLNEITQVISRQLNVNIRKLDMETDDGIFEGKVQLYVHDVEDVKAICNNLRKIPNIKSVTRVEN